jgi:hypothetical protein
MAGRKKLDRTNIHARVALGTGDKLKEIAYKLDYVYDNEGSTGQLLDAIAKRCRLKGGSHRVKLSLLQRKRQQMLVKMVELSA